MSAHGHDDGHEHEASLAHGHDEHDDHGDELAPDEPHTPSWLPLLGAALFLAAIFLYVVTRPEGGSEASPEDGAGEAPTTATAAPNAPPHPGAHAPGLREMPGHEGHGH